MNMVKNNKFNRFLAKTFYLFFGLNRVRRKGKGNKITFGISKISKTKISFFGNNNTILIKDFSLLKRVRISIHGNNNTLIIGHNSSIVGSNICFEDNNNVFELGDYSSVSNYCDFSIIESTKLLIGNECMLSSYITIRTGDSHSVISNSIRINHSKDICIGNKTWIGTKVLILKGVTVCDYSIIGAGSVVTRKFDKSNVVIAGNPASIVKENVSWEKER